MITTFDNYLFRCSALGNIVTPKGDLTVGAKTYLKECFIGEIYGVRKEAYGKALEKGIATEVDGLRMLNQTLYPGRYVPKITESKEGKYVKGTPDTIMDELVTDIKNAYTLFSFGKAELTHEHKLQVKGYCMLYGLKNGRIFYCLNNMPDYLIAEEERSMFYKQRKWISFDDPEYIKACDELRAAHTYDAMPVHHRFKVFDVEYTKDDEAKIIACVKQARTYLNELLAEHNSRIAGNESLMINAQQKQVA